MLIFILTFCLVSISGVRSNEVLKLAQTRLITILIGACTCLAVSILICPVWAGEDLHKLVAQNIAQLGNFLEGEYSFIITYTDMIIGPSILERDIIRFSLSNRAQSIIRCTDRDDKNLYDQPKQYSCRFQKQRRGLGEWNSFT